MLQSSLTLFYAQKLVKTALALMILFIGVYTFGNDVASDRFLILVMAGLGFYFRHDKNILTILLIIIAGRLFEEAVWLMEKDQIVVKLMIYTTAIVIFHKLRYDKMARFALSLILCMTIAELYWLATDYNNTPQIAYNAAVLIEDLVVRHLILYRVYSFGSWSKQLSYSSVDWKLYNIMAVFVLIVSLQVVEYFFRHIIGVQTLVIYNLFSPVVYAINYLIFWIIIEHALNNTAFFKA